MSWGYRILFIYLAFVGMIGYLIFRCTQENIDLVADNYYEKELKFQNQIDMQQNAANLNQRPLIMQLEGQQVIVIKFPDSISSGITGTITFFRPDNSKHDFTALIKPDDNGIQQIQNEKLIKGNWLVKTSWSKNGISYYQEDKVFIK